MAVCVKVKYMKIRILIVAITAVFLTALSAAGFFVYKQKPGTEVKESVPVIIGEETPTAGSKEESPTPPSGGGETLEETILLKGDFEITLPPGWQETSTLPEGFLALAIDAKEDVSSGIFQKLDFRTNLSIKSDDMTKYASMDSFEKYVESIKISLVQAIPSISFIREEQKTINGNRAILIECESLQEETGFKTLLVFIEGNNGAIYALSFNAFQSSWTSYRDAFYKIAESFKLKYKIEI